MDRYSLQHLRDSALLHELKSLVAQQRQSTALLVAHLAEVDARRLYAPAGYPSMFEYCVGELGFSEDEAYRRIRAARLAREFPSLYGMLADGRLNVTILTLLAPHLTTATADDLLSAAAHKSKAQVEQLLAGRFPRPDVPTLIEPLAPPVCSVQLAPERVGRSEPATSAASVAAPPKVVPLAPQRYAIQCTVDQPTYELIQYARSLLGHSVPAGDLPEAIHRAFAALVAQLERRKFARTERPRRCRASANARQVPAAVKRAVWERDGGRCTFVGENGHRCDTSRRLEYDHVEPVATGGGATVQGLRLRCRAHNQHEAERRFGREFMRTRRETGGRSVLPEHVAEVMPWLRSLGFKAEEARALATTCADMPDAPLEQRVRHAVRCSARPARGRAG